MELGITDLSTRLKIQKNNVFRLVATLKDRNYIEMNDVTGKYRLGLNTRVLGLAATAQTNFINHARPVLNKLKMRSRENCYLSVYKDFQAYYLDGVESDLPVRATHRIGSRLPLHCSAAGKIQLAFMRQEEMLYLMRDLELRRYTPHTITDPETLRAELNKIAHQGYAVEDQERDLGVMEIAAPVTDCNDNIVGSLCISGPAVRLAGGLVANDLITFLQSEAAQLSESLGRKQRQPESCDTLPQIPKKLRIARKVICKPSIALH